MKALTFILALGLSVTAALGAKKTFPYASPFDAKSVFTPEIILEYVNKHLNNSNFNLDGGQFPADDESREIIVCLGQLATMALAATNVEPWALLVIDSWSKLQSGLLSGNIHNLGHFDQCINTQHEDLGEFFGEELGDWGGMHCVISFGGVERVLEEGDVPGVGDILNELGVSLDFSVCVPKVCRTEFIFTMFVGLAEQIGVIGLTVTNQSLENQEKFCHTTARPPINELDIGIFVLIGILAVLAIASTAYDVILRQLNIGRNGLLVAYSFYTNGRALFSLRKSKNDIRCLYGIRSLSVIWLMLGHRYLLNMTVFPINAIDFATIFTEGFFSPFIFSFQLGIDTLLLLTGVILTYKFMKQMDRIGRFSILRMWLHYFLKVTPILMFAVLFFMSINKYLGDGPLNTFLISTQVEPCNNYWWSVLLYVQNYVNPTQLCMLHSYYLSIEMQLIWLSPLLLFPLFFWGKKFSWFVILLMLLTIGCIFTVSYWNEFMVFLLLMPLPTIAEFLRLILMPTHTRMGPWLIGVFTGYILAKMRDRKYVINRILDAFLWLVAIATSFTVIFLHHPFQQVLENNTTLFQNAMYLAFHRNLFALSVAWIIFGCHNGTGSIVNWILSRPIWQPLSRMSLCFYLIHVGGIIQQVASQRTPSYFSNGIMIHAATGDFIAGLVLATIAYLAIQAPILRIEKYIYGLFTNEKEELEQGDAGVTFKQPKWYLTFI